MAWTEAPASGESRRSTVIPHAFRHRVSTRLYHSVDFVDGGNIPAAEIAVSGVEELAPAAQDVRYSACYDRFQSAGIGRKCEFFGCRRAWTVEVLFTDCRRHSSDQTQRRRLRFRKQLSKRMPAVMAISDR